MTFIVAEPGQTIAKVFVFFAGMMSSSNPLISLLGLACLIGLVVGGFWFLNTAHRAELEERDKDASRRSKRRKRPPP
ncbi:MAG: hypothetical protein U0359_37380 [Byssovorax sp.]